MRLHSLDNDTKVIYKENEITFKWVKWTWCRWANKEWEIFRAFSINQEVTIIDWVYKIIIT